MTDALTRLRELAEDYIVVRYIYKGIRRDNGWEGFHYDYQIRAHAGGRESYAAIHSGTYTKGLGHERVVGKVTGWRSMPKATPLEVLQSLVSDAECVDGRTFAAFCDEFGYSDDSRKALSIYEECQKNT